MFHPPHVSNMICICSNNLIIVWVSISEHTWSQGHCWNDVTHRVKVGFIIKMKNLSFWCSGWLLSTSPAGWWDHTPSELWSSSSGQRWLDISSLLHPERSPPCRWTPPPPRTAQSWTASADSPERWRPGLSTGVWSLSARWWWAAGCPPPHTAACGWCFLSSAQPQRGSGSEV